MPSGLGKFVDILGDDFDLVIDSFRGSMTPEIENMLMEVGFNVVQPFWRNHAFVGAVAIK